MTNRTAATLLSIVCLLLIVGCINSGGIVYSENLVKNEVSLRLDYESNMCFDEQIEMYRVSVLPYVLADTTQNQDGFEMYIVQVYDMSESYLQSRVNEVLVSSSTSWISGAMLNSKAALPIVNHQSIRYLSVLYRYEFESGGMYRYVEDYVTIDMLTGNRVFLKDFVNNNDEFMGLVRQPGIALASGNSIQFDGNAENLWKWLSEMSNAEIKKRLDDCSKDQRMIIDEGFFSIDDSIGSVLFRDNFYIEQGNLVLVLGGWDMRVTLGLESIGSVLMVEKW